MDILNLVAEKLSLINFSPNNVKIKSNDDDNIIVLQIRQKQHILCEIFLFCNPDLDDNDDIININYREVYMDSIRYQIQYDFISQFENSIYKINNNYYKLTYIDINKDVIKLKVVKLVEYKNYLFTPEMNDIIEHVLIGYLDKDSIKNLNVILDGKARNFGVFKELVKIEQRHSNLFDLLIKLKGVCWYDVYIRYEYYDNYSYLTSFYREYLGIFEDIVKYGIIVTNWKKLYTKFNEIKRNYYNDFKINCEDGNVSQIIIDNINKLYFNPPYGTDKILKENVSEEFIFLIIIYYLEYLNLIRDLSKVLNYKGYELLSDLLFYLILHREDLTTIIKDKYKHTKLLLDIFIDDQNEDHIIRKIKKWLPEEPTGGEEPKGEE